MEWLRANRVIVVVLAGALFLGLFELSDPRLQASDTDPPRIYLDPEVNIADVSAALYPERAHSLYYLAFQASLCGDLAADAPGACGRRGPPEPGEVRELFERALATGNRSIEMALYNYALVLLHEGASADEVAAAVREWRAAYPRSQRPDPRQVFAAMQRTARRGGR